MLLICCSPVLTGKTNSNCMIHYSGVLGISRIRRLTRLRPYSDRKGRVMLAILTVLIIASSSIGYSQIGREAAMTHHLADGVEFQLSIPQVLAHGKQIFNANWTEQEGGGRPLTKGTGRPLTDPSTPLTDARAFNRISGPDANSCAGCHNAPHGISGGGGDFVTNVFLLGQRFDFITFDPKDTLPTRGT